MLSSIKFWAYVLLFCLFVMITLGGLTRLTGSGLSITEWNLVCGILPPFSESSWQEMFLKYQKSPEFLYINNNFTLIDFKKIFWLEYFHRLWGRFMGFVLLGLTFTAYKSPQWNEKYKYKTILIWMLSIAQGGMGWIMVKSGLHIQPFVSPLMLMLHLLLAGILIFTLIGMIDPKHQVLIRSPLLFYITLLLLFMTIGYGALVAGLKAGHIYNTFPLMGEFWIPQETFELRPFEANVYKNPVTVQFIHRALATLTLGLVGLCAINLWRHNNTPKSAILLITLIVFQYILGIGTLLTNVNISLATLHQFMAFANIAALSFIFWQSRPKSQRNPQQFPTFP